MKTSQAELEIKSTFKSTQDSNINHCQKCHEKNHNDRAPSGVKMNDISKFSLPLKEVDP